MSSRLILYYSKECKHSRQILSTFSQNSQILNKFDLADQKIVEQWQAHLEQNKNIKTLALTTQQPDKIKSILDLARKMFPNKSNHQFISAMIMGTVRDNRDFRQILTSDAMYRVDPTLTNNFYKFYNEYFKPVPFLKSEFIE